jgi:hypothetical protein
MFVVPIEHLRPGGLAHPFAKLLTEAGRASEAWVGLFDEAFALYWERISELSARAPRYWFPPRLQHVCIVTAPDRVRPYFQPLNRCSWLLYGSDFDPETSNAELGAYQIVHAERMGLLQEVTQTVIRNLGYWLLRSDDEVEAFRAACAASTRPDAAAFLALAEALPWIRQAHHDSLRPLQETDRESWLELPRTGLWIPRSSEEALKRLVEGWTEVAHGAMRAFYLAQGGVSPEAVEELDTWLRIDRPGVLVTGGSGRILWDPDHAGDTRTITRVLRESPEAAVRSLRADLSLIHRHSRRFLASLRDPDALPAPDPETDQGGLSYLHVERRLIAYSLEEPGTDRLRVPAPPYERLMLGARTVHEWAHLAVDGACVPIAPERTEEHERLRVELVEIFEEICRDAPGDVREHTKEDLARFAPRTSGEGLAAIPIGRVPDYQSNLLAQRYLSPTERETYVRNNVYSLALAYPSTALFRRLARYAFEYQYLRFSAVDDPRRYLLASTWFDAEYLETGILDEARLDRLLETVGRLLDCYAVDESRFVTSRD